MTKKTKEKPNNKTKTITLKKPKNIDKVKPDLSPAKKDDEIPGYKKVMILDTQEGLRELVKTITEEEIKKIRPEDLRSIYDKAKSAYPDSVKKISRKERDNLYSIQERLFGKLDPKLVASLENIGETLVKAPETRKKKINYNIPGNGAVIIKEFKGNNLEIKIIEGGFEYEGKKYKDVNE